MYSTKDAAAALGLSSPQTIRNYIDEGKLHTQYIGIRRVIRIPESELRRFAQENQIVFVPKAKD